MDPKTQYRKFVVGNVASGAAAELAGMCFIYPFDLVRTRLALDVGKKNTREFSGFRNCVSVVSVKDGLRGLYRGVFVAVVDIVVYQSAYFGLYDTAKQMMPNPDNITYP